jgi:hypothetical protein
MPRKGCDLLTTHGHSKEGGRVLLAKQSQAYRVHLRQLVLLASLLQLSVRRRATATTVLTSIIKAKLMRIRTDLKVEQLNAWH